MYYNTTNLNGSELKEAVQAAQVQTDAIMMIFKNCNKPFTPSMVWGMLQRAGHSWLLTSCRRCMTDLTEEGILEKTDVVREGLYGKVEHYWKIK